MSGLVEFLLAGIAEDEAVARAAGEGHWRIECDAEDEWMDDAERAEHFSGPHQAECAVTGPDITIYDEGGHSRDQGEHIAHWNPARVLAECEAKRAIVSVLIAWDPSPLNDEHVETAEHDAWRMLQYFALPYANRPNYREEWRP